MDRAVAGKGGAPLNQIAKDFGIFKSCLANWMKRADVEDGNGPGVTEKQSTELREAEKRVQLSEHACGGERGPTPPHQSTTSRSYDDG